MRSILKTTLTASLLCLPLVLAPPPLAAQEFTSYFNFRDCGGFDTTGRNPYMVLEPGFQLVLEGEDDGEDVQLEITVLHQTQRIGGILTRVVEEREFVDGELFEVARNFFAICHRNNTVVYFGEDVDFYEDGQIVNHNGTWRAGVNGNRAGVQLPGQPLLGSRYYQEIAPGIALDQAEIIRLDERFVTPAGTFERCLRTRETNPLEEGHIEFKVYAPGIGLINDGPLTLTEYGFE